MANFVFNVAKGTIREKVVDGAALGLLLLKAAGTDAVLRDLNTIAEVLAEGSTTEADFTNYARVTLSNVTSSVDDGNDEVNLDFDDITFTSAGGVLDNNLTDAIIYEDVGGSDATRIPLLCLDAVLTTNGANFNLNVPAGGVWSSS